MKLTTLVLIILLFAEIASAQKSSVNLYAAIDKKALQIPDSLTTTSGSIASYMSSIFTSDKDKTRAIWIWVATNISYDIENMFAINFYEKKEEKIAKPLATRKGICENYAFLFNDICLKAGIKSFVIDGYVKQSSYTSFLPHAWCSALIDSTWYMFDPTWGAGYADGNKFYKKINNDYYKVNPAKLIESHMPFDYLWQFLNYPVTRDEFTDGKTQINKSKPFFNYKDSIADYEKQSEAEQMIASVQRIEKNGLKNSLVFDRLQHTKYNIEIASYNKAIFEYNEGINKLNDFITYRNNQFKPAVPDADIQKMLDEADSRFKRTGALLDLIKNPESNNAGIISQMVKSLDDAESQLRVQQNWLTEYFSRSKLGRKTMFHKITWFGIPLN
jgi:hypothetical protein